jgi:hypothetical protein
MIRFQLEMPVADRFDGTVCPRRVSPSFESTR